MGGPQALAAHEADFSICESAATSVYGEAVVYDGGGKYRLLW